MAKIEFKGVTKEYDNTNALHNVSFRVGNNEFITLTGYSGSGKTTLLKLLLTEEEPTFGEVFVDEIDIHNLSKGELIDYRRQIGAIFQDFRLLKNKTVFENVAFVMEACGVPDEIIEEDVPYVLQLVNLSEKSDSFPRQLSGGEQQRVAIARAIVMRPEIIIADEPTGNLDPLNSYEVIDILKQINKLGHTIILTSHDKGVVKSVGGRVITLEDGSVVRDNNKGEYSV
ncbi:MAG: ATP-binding cassette domain-containing protein [Candidatus Campbellbacteria bacterium]|nr:ATP-binding cassette domain-containing protein [Candidatus Campbellbacteria bacterium]